MRQHLHLWLVLVGLLLLASCATPEQTAAAVGAVGATATALIDALRPVLSDEQMAKLHTIASNVDGGVDSVRHAVGALADAVGAVKSASAANFAAVSDAATKLHAQVATLPTDADLYMHDAGVGATSIGGARWLSVIKHGAVGKMPKAG